VTHRNMCPETRDSKIMMFQVASSPFLVYQLGRGWKSSGC
jgi:hypothetical protein